MRVQPNPSFTMSKPIARNRSASPATGTTSQSFGASYRSQSRIAAIAEESIAQDLEDERREEQDDEDDALERVNTAERIAVGPHSMTGYYRRPSYMAATPRPFLGAQQPEHVVPAEQDWEAAIGEERSLLRDNGIIPPKHPRRRESAASETGNGLKKMLSRISMRRKSGQVDEEGSGDQDGILPSENTALLGGEGRDPNAPYGGEDSPENISRKWEEAVEGGMIHTTWQRESKVLGRYSGPLIFTFIDRKSTRLNSSHSGESRMPSSA